MKQLFPRGKRRDARQPHGDFQSRNGYTKTWEVHHQSGMRHPSTDTNEAFPELKEASYKGGILSQPGSAWSYCVNRGGGNTIGSILLEKEVGLMLILVKTSSSGHLLSSCMKIRLLLLFVVTPRVAAWSSESHERFPHVRIT